MEFNTHYSISMPTTLNCEALVIGSGIGGSTLAYKLLESGIDVLMIEEGPFIEDIYRRSQHKNFSEVWRNGGLSVALGKPPIAYAEARCVGGGSEINSGIFQHASDILLDELAEKYNIEQFSAKILKPFYEAAENMVNANYLEYKSDSLLLERAAKNLGWNVAPLKITQKDNVKQSISKTLLPAALKNGLRLIAQCKATKLIFMDRRVVAVKATAIDHKGNLHSVSIRPQYVFLCAGAICTPHLLLKSGIKKNVGESLQMHPTVRTLCQFEETLGLNSSTVPSCAITEFMPDIRIGGSVMLPSFIGMFIADDPKNRAKLLTNMDNCGIYYAMIKAEAKGKIKHVWGCKDPLVRFNPTNNDWENIFKALDYLQQAMFAAGASIVFPSIERHHGWKEKTSLEAIKTTIRKRMNLLTIHLFSSCPMGEKKNICAVNSFGKMHDYRNLYINDASIIPEALGTNPQGTILALSLRNAEHFIKVGRG